MFPPQGSGGGGASVLTQVGTGTTYQLSSAFDGGVVGGQWARWFPTVSTTSITGVGSITAQVVDTTSTSANDANGRYFSQSTAASIGSDAYSHGSVGVSTSPTLNWFSVFKFSLQSTSDVRFFVGWSSLAANTQNGSDDPAGDYVGLQFSTGRPDTNFVFVSKDGSTQATHASTQAVSTGVFFLTVDVSGDGTSYLLTLLDSTGTEVDSHEFTSNLPSAEMRPQIVTSALAASAVTQRIYDFAWHQRL